MVTVLMFMYSSIASSPLKNSLLNVFLKFIYLHLYLQDYNKNNSVSYFNNNSRISMLDQIMVCWFHCYIITRLLQVTLLSVKWINYLSKKRVTQTSRDRWGHTVSLIFKNIFVNLFLYVIVFVYSVIFLL